jgi:hypothetical protein
VTFAGGSAHKIHGTRGRVKADAADLSVCGVHGSL